MGKYCINVHIVFASPKLNYLFFIDQPLKKFFAQKHNLD